MKTKVYHALVKTLISHSIPEIKSHEIEGKDFVFLDTRSQPEYDISHISGAKFVGYDDFAMSHIDGIPKEKPIVLYCSVSYRSEKIGEKLLEAGYSEVYNLYGGLFEWHNTGHEVVDSQGQVTNKVHGYGKLWGKWLFHADVVYDKDD